MQRRSCDVAPESDQDKYTIALMTDTGKWAGFDVPLNRIIPHTINTPAPQQQVTFNSWHKGQGSDRYLPREYRFHDSQNIWRTTPEKLHATPLWEFADGFVNEDMSFPGDNGVEWHGLYGSNRALAVSFDASASYDAAHIYMLIRKGVPAGSTGTPGSLTIELCADSSDPHSVLKTVTLDPATIGDVVSLVQVFDLSSAQSLTGSTTYWVKIYGESSDKKNGCWEVGCDNSAAGVRQSDPTTAAGSWNATTFSPYYRVQAAEVAQKVTPFVFDGVLYAITSPDAGGTNKLWINGNRGRATSGTTTTLVDTSHGIYGTATVVPDDTYNDWWIRIVRGTGQGQVRQITDTSSTSYTFAAMPIAPDATSEYIIYGGKEFLNFYNFGYPVVSRPVVSQRIVYFPHGDADPITTMGISYSDDDDHVFDSQTESGVVGNASFMAKGYDSRYGGATMWRANQGAGTGSAGVKTTSFVATPNTNVYTTDLVFANAVSIGDTTWRMTNLFSHQNSIYLTTEDGLFQIQNNVPIQISMGAESNPSPYNGLAFASGNDRALYLSTKNDVMRVEGGSAIPTGIFENKDVDRTGIISDMISESGWIFAAVDAEDGTSSVMLFALDQGTWSEHVRAFAAGYRIRELQWHYCPGTNPELWYDCGGHLIRQQFPKNGTRPIKDSSMRYWHEGVVELPPIDLLSVDNKYYSQMVGVIKNLASEATSVYGREVVVEYQLDNDVGTDNWTHAGRFLNSPSDNVKIDKGGKRVIGIRLRLISSSATQPVIVESVRLTLFTRNPFIHQWQVFFELLADDEEQPSLRLLEWLRELAGEAEALTLKSTFHLLHNKRVTITDEPYYQVSDWEADEDEVEANLNFMLAEVA